MYSLFRMRNASDVALMDLPRDRFDHTVPRRISVGYAAIFCRCAGAECVSCSVVNDGRDDFKAIAREDLYGASAAEFICKPLYRPRIVIAYMGGLRNQGLCCLF